MKDDDVEVVPGPVQLLRELSDILLALGVVVDELVRWATEEGGGPPGDAN